MDLMLNAHTYLPTWHRSQTLQQAHVHTIIALGDNLSTDS